MIKEEDELKKFAINNNIKIVKRPFIWEWILEPFLDTEFTAKTDQQLTKFLEDYGGLTVNYVKSLRAEIETQMFKYI